MRIKISGFTQMRVTSCFQVGLLSLSLILVSLITTLPSMSNTDTAFAFKPTPPSSAQKNNVNTSLTTAPGSQTNLLSPNASALVDKGNSLFDNGN
jgi:hypothetical protein